VPARIAQRFCGGLDYGFGSGKLRRGSFRLSDEVGRQSKEDVDEV